MRHCPRIIAAIKLTFTLIGCSPKQTLAISALEVYSFLVVMAALSYLTELDIFSTRPQLSPADLLTRLINFIPLPSCSPFASTICTMVGMWLEFKTLEKRGKSLPAQVGLSTHIFLSFWLLSPEKQLLNLLEAFVGGGSFFILTETLIAKCEAIRVEQEEEKKALATEREAKLQAEVKMLLSGLPSHGAAITSANFELQHYNAAFPEALFQRAAHRYLSPTMLQNCQVAVVESTSETRIRPNNDAQPLTDVLRIMERDSIEKRIVRFAPFDSLPRFTEVRLTSLKDDPKARKLLLCKRELVSEDDSEAKEARRLEFMAKVIAKEHLQPLQSIISFSELLCSKVEDSLAELELFQEDEQQAKIESLRRQLQAHKIILSSAQLLRLLNSGMSNLTLTRQQVQAAETQQVTSLHQHLVEFTRLFEEHLAAKNIKVRIEESVAGPASAIQRFSQTGVLLNVDFYKQIMYNIFMNACKFNKNNGSIRMGLRVDFASETGVLGGLRQANSIVLTTEVQDSGVGIPDSAVDKICTLLVRSNAKQKRDAFTDLSAPQGAGLGLHISLQLAKILKGSIKVESQFGRGTLVKVSITVPVYSNKFLQIENTSTNETSFSSRIDNALRRHSQSIFSPGSSILQSLSLGFNNAVAIRTDSRRQLLQGQSSHNVAAIRRRSGNDNNVIDSTTFQEEVKGFEEEGKEEETGQSPESGDGPNRQTPRFSLPEVVPRLDSLFSKYKKGYISTMSEVKDRNLQLKKMKSQEISPKSLELPPQARRRSGSLLMPSGSPELPLSCSSILLIEDNPQNLQAICSLLRNIAPRIQPDTASDGVIGLQAIKAKIAANTEGNCSCGRTACQNKYYKLVITDINMPNMGGIECAKQIINTLADAGSPLCKIIAVTAFSTPQVIEECRQAGIEKVIRKPVKHQDLVSLVQPLLGSQN